MLRNVLGDYLDRVKERAFDLPLLHLLPFLSFDDYHFTHGPVELGKDIIAKRRDDGVLTQYVIQSKVGNITPTLWERTIRPQLETAIWTEVSHPRFDPSLPRRIVLVTTGELRHNATIQAQDFAKITASRLPHVSIDFWDKRDLLEMLLEHGLEGVYRATSGGAIAYDRFLVLTANAMRGDITPKDIERHSRIWGDLDIDRNGRLLISALETEVLGRLCAERGLAYESIHLRLAQMRLLCELSYQDECTGLRGLWDRELEVVHSLCATYIDQFRSVWEPERNLAQLLLDDLTMTTYPVHCLRALEVAALAYLTSTDDDERHKLASFLSDFVRVEPGCSRPISDRAAVSVALGVLALLTSSQVVVAETYLEKLAMWLCDRYSEGFGLAGVEADEAEETIQLLGYPFESIPTSKRRTSFLATVLMDLAALVGNYDLYSAIVNDVKSCDIIAEYWQPKDSVGACRYEGKDVVQYPRVDFADELYRESAEYAEHVREESAAFRFAECFGNVSAVILMALLRDRYFPKLWPALISTRPG